MHFASEWWCSLQRNIQLPRVKVFKNIFYKINQNRYETDGIIVYDGYVFIVEAKANLFSDKAKKGHNLKTNDHINDIIKDLTVKQKGL